MFRIGEFSKLVRVSPRMLRYYEQCGLLSPTEVDRFTGYRMYSAEQIPRLFLIVELRDMGFGIDEMSEILPHIKDAEFMREILERKIQDVQSVISSEQNKLNKIAVFCDKIKREKTMIFDVELKRLPAEKVLSLRQTVREAGDEPLLWEKLAEFAEKNNVKPLLKWGCTPDCKCEPICECGIFCGCSIYHDDEYKDTGVDIEVAIPVGELNDVEEEGSPFEFKELPSVEKAATIRFSGSYDAYGGASQKLAEWVEANGYECDGTMRGIGIVMPAKGVSPEDCLTELQLPVKNRN